MSNFQERRFELLGKKFEAMGQNMVHHQSGYLGLAVGDGRQNRVGQPEEFPQDDEQTIAQAISYVQKISEQYPDAFAKWASTSDILKNVSGDSVRKATVNRSGQTSDPVSYPANSESSLPGIRKTITTDELSNDAQLKRLVASAEDLIQQRRMHEGHLRAKILHVSKL
jgi:hypothetical protein